MGGVTRDTTPYLGDGGACALVIACLRKPEDEGSLVGLVKRELSSAVSLFDFHESSS